jgi:hypothetical protein
VQWSRWIGLSYVRVGRTAATGSVGCAVATPVGSRCESLPVPRALSGGTGGCPRPAAAGPAGPGRPPRRPWPRGAAAAAAAPPPRRRRTGRTAVWYERHTRGSLRCGFLSRAPVNFTCRSWTTGVSSPCHFQLASILSLRSFYEISPMRRSILLVEVESLPISHNPYHSCIRHGR